MYRLIQLHKDIIPTTSRIYTISFPNPLLIYLGWCEAAQKGNERLNLSDYCIFSYLYSIWHNCNNPWDQLVKGASSPLHSYCSESLSICFIEEQINWRCKLPMFYSTEIAYEPVRRQG